MYGDRGRVFSETCIYKVTIEINFRLISPIILLSSSSLIDVQIHKFSSLLKRDYLKGREDPTVERRDFYFLLVGNQAPEKILLLMISNFKNHKLKDVFVNILVRDGFN